MAKLIYHCYINVFNFDISERALALKVGVSKTQLHVIKPQKATTTLNYTESQGSRAKTNCRKIIEKFDKKDNRIRR